MDPLSITASVLSLVGVCLKTSTALRAFHAQVESIDERLDSMLHDVDTLRTLLESMQDTFQTIVQPVTGHIGTHWANINRSLTDGRRALEGLEAILSRANRDVSLLQGPRKQLRLEAADMEIKTYRAQIQTFRDTMQLSLQAIILWNQASEQTSASRILPRLDDIYCNVERLALNLNMRIQNLEVATADASDNGVQVQQIEMQTMNNLQSCVRSAATVVSSASTVLREESYASESLFGGSELGDLFPPISTYSTLAWLSSSQVASSVARNGTTSAYGMSITSSGEIRKIACPTSQSLRATVDRSESDSDSDLDLDLAESLLQTGRRRFIANDYQNASRLLENCLSRIPDPFTSSNNPNKRGVSKREVLSLLCDSYVRMDKWDDAQSAIMAKIALNPHGLDAEDKDSLLDLCTLVKILYQQQGYVEAQLYARRALRGYKKLGSEGMNGAEQALIFLVDICRASGSVDEGEAYAAMLEAILESKVARAPSQGSAGVAGKQRDLMATTAAIATTATTQLNMATCDLNALRLEETRISTVSNNPLSVGPAGAKPVLGTTEARLLLAKETCNNVKFSGSLTQSTLSGASESRTNSASQREYTDQDVDLKVTCPGHSSLPSIDIAVPQTLGVSKMRLEKKLIVIGEQRVGKTRLLELLSKGYTRHRFKNSASFFATERTFAVELDLAIIEFSMWDSQGKEDYEHLRPLLYPGTDVVLLVFDTTNRYSLNLIDKKWVSDVWHYMQGAQYILVGNKSDERDARENLMTADQSLVSHKQGEAMAKRIGAKAYVECSLSNRNSMCRVLEVAARYCVQAEGQKKEKGTGWISRLRRK